MASAKTSPTAVGFGERETACKPRNRAEDWETTNSPLECSDRNSAEALTVVQGDTVSF